MRGKTTVIATLILAASILGSLGFTGAGSTFFGDISQTGILRASFASQQEVQEDSARDTSPPAGEVSPGIEPVADLLVDQPVTREVRDLLRKREEEVAAREKEVARRESVLRDLMRTIDAKLAELERKRKDLLALTAEVDDLRREELDAAVKIFRAMEPVSAAKLFNQMDLEKVVDVLKKMTPTTAGAILTAMRAEVEQMEETKAETDAGQVSEKARKLQKMKEIGETLVDPLRAKL